MNIFVGYTPQQLPPLYSVLRNGIQHPLLGKGGDGITITLKGFIALIHF
ncbi:MAG: hypothetical protein ABIN89_05080 [Chitinophagaceae bacterium]